MSEVISYSKHALNDTMNCQCENNNTCDFMKKTSGLKFPEKGHSLVLLKEDKIKMTSLADCVHHLKWYFFFLWYTKPKSNTHYCRLRR